MTELNKKFEAFTIDLIDEVEIIIDELGLQEVKPEWLETIGANVALLNALDAEEVDEAEGEDEDEDIHKMIQEGLKYINEIASCRKGLKK